MSPRPRVRLLEEREVDEIVGEACRVLEVVGVLVESAEAGELLAASGATARAGRWFLPERLAREALAGVPGSLRLFDSHGAPALDLEGDRVHFDPGSAAIWLIDGSERRRAIASADLFALGRLVEDLPHYAAQSTALVPGDVPLEIADRYRLYLALKTCRKPIVTGTFAGAGFAPMRAMLEAVRGGPEALAERPLALFDCCPTAPLRWSELTCQALIDCARARIPAQVVSVPLAGATAPVTLREAVVQHCAENLSGIVIHQLARRGAPLVYGGAPSAFDMRHGTTPLGAIESMMMAVAYVQVGKHLGLPTHAYLGLSDAKCVDYQAGFETGIGALLAALAGVNLVSGAGMLDFASSQSFEKLLLDHDVCGAALRLVRGIEPRGGEVVALLAELVRAGTLLSHPHTREHWRAELGVASPLLDRGSYGDWEAGGRRSAQQRAAAEVERRLARPFQPVLAPGPLEAVTRIMSAEAARHGLATLPL